MRPSRLHARVTGRSLLVASELPCEAASLRRSSRETSRTPSGANGSAERLAADFATLSTGGCGWQTAKPRPQKGLMGQFANWPATKPLLSTSVNRCQGLCPHQSDWANAPMETSANAPHSAPSLSRLPSSNGPSPCEQMHLAVLDRWSWAD